MCAIPLPNIVKIDLLCVSMNFQAYEHSTDELLSLYKKLVYPRLIEEKMLKLLRQGQISKWFSGIGQEAIAVGATAALEFEDHIFPLHRNLGVFTTRGIPFKDLLYQWQGQAEGFTKGRDRSFHFGAPDYNIIGMISHLGAMLSVADGVALASLLKQQNNICMAFSGEGGTSEGEFHEALNLAAVWDLPVLFIVENNGYGLSTPSSQQFRCESIASKGVGYGIASETIDGNNILEVYNTVQRIARSMRSNPKPFLLECNTFRMRGHEEASGTKYVPDELMDEWAKKDPITNFEYFLTKHYCSTAEIDSIKASLKANIEQDALVLRDLKAIESTEDKELNDVFKEFNSPLLSVQQESTHEIRFIDAIQEGLSDAMDRFDDLILMGQDIAEYGGVFKITEGFTAKYGADRVRNTPISEAAPLGAALGLSIKGMKSMVEMQFADFVSCGFNQIVNNLAKTHYRWTQNADVVIRMPTGAGAAAGPFHSQSNEAWFFHVPGLKIVYPSTPTDAKGLLMRSIHDPNPVLFFEHKYLYRSITEEVPDTPYEIEIGKAAITDLGDELCMISYGWATHWCRQIATELDLKAKIVDLRTLIPWDKEAVMTAVQSCGKVIIVHEDNLTGGIGAEISAWISEHCFEFLDAPVVRVGSLDTPIPFNKKLEDQYLGLSKLKEKVEWLMEY